jgi:PIN domain nuclease of toxin-antitoxin system
MNLLLDTHVLLWSLFESDRLSDLARELFTDIENDIFVSVFSFWEISLKYGSEKLSLTMSSPMICRRLRKRPE